MKRLLLIGLCLAPAAGWAAPTLSPHIRTTGDLADLCGVDGASPLADASTNYCHGFAQGAVDVRLRIAHDKKPFCFPSPAPTRTATMHEFVDWVKANPGSRDKPALDGLFKFLGDRFPCK